MHDELIKRYIKEKLHKDAIVLTRLMGGMSNYTYVIEIEGEKYTFRVPGKGAEHFTNRKQEAEIMKSIEPYHFLPKPIINDVETGYKVAPYVEGQILSEVPDKPLETIAAILKKVNSIPKFDYDYEPLKRLADYEALSNELDPVYQALKEKFLDIYQQQLQFVPLVACHGDAQVSNFVLAEDKIYLMDWEFAANNDPIYDIACFGNATFDDALNLIEVYYDNPGPDKYQRLYAWRMFQCLQWHCVAKYKHIIGLSEELAIDFGYVAKQYLVKAKEFFQDYLNITEKGE